MGTIHILASILGITLVLTAVSIFNKKTYEALLDGLEHNRALLWLSGFMTFVLGLVVLALYNTWSGHWQVIITILAWLMVLKGIFMTLLPDTAASIYRKVKGGTLIRIVCLIGIVVGLYLLIK